MVLPILPEYRVANQPGSRERGRLAPDGLRYVTSVVSADGDRCYQLMECEDPALLDAWTAAWADLVAFEVVPVVSSAEAAARFGPG